MRMSTYRNIRVSNFSIRFLRDTLIDAGLDDVAAFRDAGIDPALAERAGGVVSGEQELAFQRTFVALTEDRSDLWVQAGSRYTVSAFGAHGWAGLTSPTLAHWVRNAAQSDLTFTFASFTPLTDRDGRISGTHISYPEAPAELLPFSIHRDVAAVARTLRTLLDVPSFPFESVRLPLNDVAPQLVELIAGSIELGGTAVHLRWDASLSSLPLPHGDQFQHEAWVRQAREQVGQFHLERDWINLALLSIKAELVTGATLNSVAEDLNTSPRTLQRRFERGGVTFRELRDRARYELAVQLLTATNFPVSEISRRLGYDEPASFTVAFRRWSGMLPSHFRHSPPAFPQMGAGA